mmetsp:Transcript_75689/g.133638  ORF Transcript_75689/g.133638 Transcript_75689/m.133638 type:complete len:263 (+) Transcript_75689:1171-1959(+)
MYQLTFQHVPLFLTAPTGLHLLKKKSVLLVSSFWDLLIIGITRGQASLRSVVRVKRHASLQCKKTLFWRRSIQGVVMWPLRSYHFCCSHQEGDTSPIQEIHDGHRQPTVHGPCGAQQLIGSEALRVGVQGQEVVQESRTCARKSYDEDRRSDGNLCNGRLPVKIVFENSMRAKMGIHSIVGEETNPDAEAVGSSLKILSKKSESSLGRNRHGRLAFNSLHQSLSVDRQQLPLRCSQFQLRKGRVGSMAHSDQSSSPAATLGR